MNIAFPKPSRAVKDARHLERVSRLPCVICHEYGMRQNSRTEVHHCKSGRYGQTKASDALSIPLCHSHHHKLRAIPGDENKIGFHNGQATWEAKYGVDYHWIDWVENRLELEDEQ